MSQNEKDAKPSDKSTNKNVKKTTNANKRQTRPKIGLFSLIIGIIFLLYEVVNIVICILVEFNSNKPTVERSTLFLTFHIIFHSLIILFDISLFLISFNKIKSPWTLISPLLFLVTLVFYVTYALAFLIENKEYKNMIEIEKLQKIVNNTTVTHAFFYSKGLVKSQYYSFNPMAGQQTRQERYEKCYSNSSILLPLKSKQISEKIELSNLPEYFFFQIILDLKMSNEFQFQYYETISKIRSCNSERIQIKFLPKINKTFIVGNPNFPMLLNHKYRNLAAALGACLYYDDYCKSIQFLTYKPKIEVDVDPDFNFESLWEKKWCKSYGKCEANNQKPRPDIDDL